ncbi:MAG: hypothetical protein QOI95_363 [Acidimicrobiaceae bacterium]
MCVINSFIAGELELPTLLPCVPAALPLRLLQMRLLKSGAVSCGASRRRMIVDDPPVEPENGVGEFAGDLRTISVLFEPADELELEDDDEEADALLAPARLAVRRSAAEREFALRRIVDSPGAAADGFGAFGGAGAAGDAPASALISPPLAPTVRPAVPKVGVRLSIASERRTGAFGALRAALDPASRPALCAVFCPAIVGGCITRIKLPVARARSSSGECRSSSKKRGIGDGRAACTSSWANTSADGDVVSGEAAKCTTLSTVAARLPALRNARLVAGPERTATGRGPAMARARGANLAGTGRAGSAGRSRSASRKR